MNSSQSPIICQQRVKCARNHCGMFSNRQQLLNADGTYLFIIWPKLILSQNITKMNVIITVNNSSNLSHIHLILWSFPSQTAAVIRCTRITSTTTIWWPRVNCIMIHIQHVKCCCWLHQTKIKSHGWIVCQSASRSLATKQIRSTITIQVLMVIRFRRGESPTAHAQIVQNNEIFAHKNTHNLKNSNHTTNYGDSTERTI